MKNNLCIYIRIVIYQMYQSYQIILNYLYPYIILLSRNQCFFCYEIIE